LSATREAEAIERRLLLQAILERYGYDFRGYSPESMARRLNAALARTGMKHLGEMQHRVLFEPELLGGLLDALTVQVSEMFRDPDFFRVLRNKVVPLLRTYPRIKIWHAGCASGEEVYATAVVLFEEGLLERAQVYATDVNSSAVERAREGVYPEAQLATFAANYAAAGGKARIADYCVSAYGRIAFREDLRKNLMFFQHNLASDYALGEMQLIFCRNVLIYFGQELRARVMDLFSGCLCRGGFLCLGNSEHLSHEHEAFEEFASVERIYRKLG
jgi:chemotaxis protein methyltransferase CheR